MYKATKNICVEIMSHGIGPFITWVSCSSKSLSIYLISMSVQSS